MTYSYSDLENLWIRAGGPKNKANVAAAIALAESGGNPNAVNSSNSDGSIDRGLWQVNSVHGSQSTLDPLANAKAAVAISNNGSNFSPWVTYQQGDYKKWLKGGSGTKSGSSARSAGTSSAGSSYTDRGSTSTGSSSSSKSGLAKYLGDWKVILAVLLILVGVMMK